jgi:hypothetical protein
MLRTENKNDQGALRTDARCPEVEPENPVTDIEYGTPETVLMKPGSVAGFTLIRQKAPRLAVEMNGEESPPKL